MPRLVGRKQSHIGLYLLSAFALVIAAGGSLQYYGLVNFPGLIQQVKLEVDKSSAL
jgi:hypothetical protein